MKPFLDDSATLNAARTHANSLPLEAIDVSNWDLFRDDSVFAYFERLRAEDPVHVTESSRFGRYWSVTRFNDIKQVDTDHATYSSEPNLIIHDLPDFEMPSFLNMDPPRHDEQRKAVAPIVGPRNLGNLESTIRERVNLILDNVPLGEEVDWVGSVSVELTSQMLATLMDYPFDDRHRLVQWSDAFSLGVEGGGVLSRGERNERMQECLEHFTKLKEERALQAPRHDLISMLAHGEATRDLKGLDLLANIVLLIVGGNDTTRNTITASVLAMNKFPDEYEKVKSDPSLVPNMVSEVIRWQTPLAHMRRTAKIDTELGGKMIRAGEKVVMWYISGNRDAAVFDDADHIRVDRANARNHLSFGYGIHRCLGNRLAEMQLRVLWEEMLRRFERVEVVGPPVRTRSNFIHGYLQLPVVVHGR